MDEKKVVPMPYIEDKPMGTTGSNANENEKINLEEQLESLSEILDMSEDDSILNSLVTMLSINDESFDAVSETFLITLEDSLNKNKNLFRLMNQQKGYDREQFITSLTQIHQEVQQSDFSQIKKDFLVRFVGLIFNIFLENDDPSKHYVSIPYQFCKEVEKPTYANEGDAGMDLYSPADYTIPPGETIIIPTGIKVAIPQGYALLIQPRSGQSAKTKLRIANTPGLIDSGYRDEIGVIIENIDPPFKDIDYDFNEDGTIKINSILHGNTYTIDKGQKFAQMRLVQVPMAALFEVQDIHEIEGDRGGGFGSTDG